MLEVVMNFEKIGNIWSHRNKVRKKTEGGAIG